MCQCCNGVVINYKKKKTKLFKHYIFIRATFPSIFVSNYNIILLTSYLLRFYYPKIFITSKYKSFLFTSNCFIMYKKKNHLHV